MSKTYFNSQTVYNTEFESINEETGVIKGVKVTSQGEAKGHGVMLDRKFVNQVVKFGKERGDVGLKARFGHPNMCNTALGTYLGRYKNFRRSGDHAIADLHLDEVAKESPKGDLHNYVMQMAKTNPDQFGSSIVFTPAESEFKNEEDSNGELQTVEYARVKDLHATDLVDTPAATDGLFSQFTEDDAAAQLTMFLDNNPSIFELATKHPDLIENFMTKYTIHKEKQETQNTKTIMSSLKETLASAKEAYESAKKAVFASNKDESVEVKITDDEDVKTKFEAMDKAVESDEAERGLLKKTNEDLTKEFEEGVAKNKELSEANEKQATEIKELTAKLSKANGGQSAGKGDDAVIPGDTPTEFNEGQKFILDLKKQ